MPNAGAGRVLVVGGGVIGLLSAWNLARAGWRVTLLERQRLGEESSWAGGGIVSPLYPWRYGHSVAALAAYSQGSYANLCRQLSEATGIDPELYETGLYWLDLEDEEVALHWAEREHQPLRKVSLDTMREHVPCFGEGYRSAVYMPGIANVRNPRLLKALQKVSGISLHEHSVVQRLLVEDGRVCGVRTVQGDYRAERVLLAAGAWSGQLLASLGLELPVAPVKGQMILYKCAEDFLPAMVLAKGRYAIPRKDGHILVGSTLEHVGFDKTPTEGALKSLKASAEELLPALADAEVVGHWAGLRPGSPDGIPFIGEVPQYPGLWLNCGHYRNGLVLAPASCELLKNLMLGEAPIVDPTPYSPAGRLS